MIDQRTWDAVAAGTHHGPHDVLGLHPVTMDASSRPEGVEAPSAARWVVRARRPQARSVAAVLENGRRVALTHRYAGIWEGALEAHPSAYMLETEDEDGTRHLDGDPYRHLPTLSAFDLHLISQGRHERLWEVLGAHLCHHGGEDGVAFAVWAPAARAVRVIGDLNGWDGSGSAMRSLGSSGVWELFVPAAREGDRYLFEILTGQGTWIRKADPMARRAELPPATASIVTASQYRWQDAEWMARREQADPTAAPMSVYEVHLGSWRSGMTYRRAIDELVPYVREQGFTHVEFMPLAEHPFGGSWGYQVSGYYAPTSRYGTPDQLRALVDAFHRAGVGVILDWVPGHFPKDDFALGRFDGTALYEHPDPRRGEHQDWGTFIFDYGRAEVRGFLVANALYWLERFHIDGLRVDAVASMLYLDYSRAPGQWEPNIHGGRENLEAVRFLQEVTAAAHRCSPGTAIIAEESTSFPGVTAPVDRGGLGFDLKWNMGWMNDALVYIARDPVHRAAHAGELAFSFVYAFSEQFVLPISHDEVVHGKRSLLAKMPGDHERQLAGVRSFLGYMWAHPGRQLLFMGQEFGQLSEWSADRELDWWMLDQPGHGGLQRLVRDLNLIQRAHPALWRRDGDAEAFTRLGEPTWNPDVCTFSRRGDGDEQVAVVCNFAGIGMDLPLRLPAPGRWTEILNTEASVYGGNGQGNLGSVLADQEGMATLYLPALSVLWLAPEPVSTSTK